MIYLICVFISLIVLPIIIKHVNGEFTIFDIFITILCAILWPLAMLVFVINYIDNNPDLFKKFLSKKLF